MGTHLPSSPLDPPFSHDPSPPARSIASRPIGDLWRRFLAFAVDCAFLGLVGFVLGLFFFRLFSQLGPWGRLVGFFISLVYFSVMESAIGGGQSLGKLWLKLIVVDAQGNTIPFEQAVLRFTIFAVPGFLFGLPLPVSRTPWAVVILLGVVLLGAGGATLYLIVFNRATRQGLHDLAVGSYVASAAESGPVAARPARSKHWLVAASIPVVALVAGVFAARATHWGLFPGLMDDLRFVERMYGVQRGAAYAQTTYRQDGDRSSTLEITACFDEDLDAPSAQAGLIARHLLQYDPRARMYDSIRIVIQREYDIGIARGSHNSSFENSPEEWSRRVLDTPLLEPPQEAQK